MANLSEEQQDIALKAIASTLGRPVSEIETLLTGDKPSEVDKMVSDRIKSVREEGTKSGKGMLQKAANAKAKELFKIDADPDKIEELLDVISKTYKPEIKPEDLTEEQVKMHPTFRSLETQLQNKDKEFQTTLTQKEQEWNAKVSEQQVKAMALKALNDFGAVIHEDAKIAAVQERMFLERFQGVTLKEVDGKTEFWKEGKRIEDSKLFPVAADDFLKGMVESVYTIKVSDQKEGAGVPPGSGSGGGGGKFTFTHFKGTPPKTLEEVNSILRDRNKYSYAERDEVTKYWAEQQKPA
ncbi:hypothetical protein GGR92_004799 [Spirosoma lacussanchae]|uniref:hypothetical protein n=1 Tax=Spirosoma lacussanchae TaxID=1884249 RepID=UPI001108710D|nr:hypothetical protein [Spirosoma lacussanchae]